MQPIITSISGSSPIASNQSKDNSSNSSFYTGPTQNLLSQFEDLPDYIPTQMDVKIVSVFDGEYIRNNNRTHLDRDISDDKVW